MTVLLLGVVAVGFLGIYAGCEPYARVTMERVWMFLVSVLMLGGGVILLYRHLLETWYDG